MAGSEHPESVVEERPVAEEPLVEEHPAAERCAEEDAELYVDEDAEQPADYQLWDETKLVLTDESDDDGSADGGDAPSSWVRFEQSASVIADDSEGWSPGTFDPEWPDAGSAEGDGFEEFASAMPAAQVKLIKETMASIHITPPPWVRKMQQVQKIQQALGGVHGERQAQQQAQQQQQQAQQPADLLAAQWAAQVQERTPCSHLLDGDTVAQASPLTMAPVAMPSGMVAPRRVSAKALAAERRALREKAKAERAAAAEAAATTSES